jgi:hypothetical protein
MPFALVIIGLLMIVTGVRNTHAAFGQQIITDFTGPQNFTTWLVAIGAVGALGYIEPLKPLSRAFMTLIIISFVVKNGGVFNKLQEALALGPVHNNENTMGSKQNADLLGSIKIADHSAEYVDSLSQTVQAGITANAAVGAARATAAQKTFATVAKVAMAFI